MTRMKRMNWTGVVFVAPSILIVLALLIYPVFSSIWYSFTDKHLLRHSYHVVGLSNYTDLLASSSFWNAFGVSIKWTAASIIGQLAVGLVLALALDRVPRGQECSGHSSSCPGLPGDHHCVRLEVDPQRRLRVPAQSCDHSRSH